MSAHRSRSWIMCPNAFAQATEVDSRFFADRRAQSTRTALPTSLPGAEMRAPQQADFACKVSMHTKYESVDIKVTVARVLR